MADPYERARQRMVDTQIVPSDIEDEVVVEAMRRVPRHLFVPQGSRHLAYRNHPVPVGCGQTISQPYIVAYMIQLARIDPGDRVLDVGTGSGYQAAVLAEMGVEVYTIEIVEALATRAARALAEAGYDNVHSRLGDGHRGWAAQAPFDAILVAASPTSVPPELKRQLTIGGRLVLPVGDEWQQHLLCVLRTGADSWEESIHLPVLFVPMTGTPMPR